MHQSGGDIAAAVRGDAAAGRAGGAPGWLVAVAAWGSAHGWSLASIPGAPPAPLEIGFLGVSGVGKSSLLNALISPGVELLPAGGVGPLTGVPVRIVHASAATLRVAYLGRSWWLEVLDRLDASHAALTGDELGRLSLLCTGNQYAMRDPAWLARALRHALQPDRAPPPDGRAHTEALHRARELLLRDGAAREWDSSAPDGRFARRIHDHVAGSAAAVCEHIEIGWPSALLHAGAVIVDLPGLGAASDAYAGRTRAWAAQASAVVAVVDRAGLAESLVACLDRSGFLRRMAAGQADLLGVATKLDQVTDDVRRRDAAGRSWPRCFRAVAAEAVAEIESQIGDMLRFALAPAGPGAARPCGAIGAFGVSSHEHRRVVRCDPEDRPRLLVEESTGVPAVRRALVALARLRSTAGTTALLDHVRRQPDAPTLLPALLSLAAKEES